MGEAGLAPGSATEVLVTLVHGTWSRGILKRRRRSPGAWFEPRSVFADSLRADLAGRGLAMRYSTSLWSGANSIRARYVGAQRLARNLERRRRAVPDRPHVVIAHSHGGNVALKAFEELGGPDVPLVTMATPFVTVVPRPVPRVLIGVGAATLLAVMFWMYHVAGRYESWKADALAGIVFILCAAVLGVLAYGIGRLRRRALTMTHRGVAPGRVLCLRGRSDEASLALGLGTLGVEASRRIIGALMWLMTVLEPYRERVGRREGWVGRFGSGTWFYTPVLGICLFTAIALGTLATKPFTIVVSLLVGAWLGAYLLSALSLIVLGLELFTAGLGLMPSVESVPDTTEPVDVVTLESHRESLRHFLYDEEACVPRIGEWIAGVVQADKPDETASDGPSNAIHQSVRGSKLGE